EIDTDDSLGFRLRSGGKGAPGEGQLSVLNDALRVHLIDKLAAALPGKLVPDDEMVAAMTSKGAGLLNPAGSVYWRKISKYIGVKYLLTVVMDSLYFKGHTLTGEEYELEVSAQLKRADTGSVLWQMDQRNFSKRTFGEKRDPVDYFQEVMTGSVADYICQQVG